MIFIGLGTSYVYSYLFGVFMTWHTIPLLASIRQMMMLILAMIQALELSGSLDIVSFELTNWESHLHEQE